MQRNTEGLTKPKWNNTPTVAIRVPSIFRDQILDHARQLDNAGRDDGNQNDGTDDETDPKL